MHFKNKVVNQQCVKNTSLVLALNNSYRKNFSQDWLKAQNDIGYLKRNIQTRKLKKIIT